MACFLEQPVACRLTINLTCWTADISYRVGRGSMVDPTPTIRETLVQRVGLLCSSRGGLTLRAARQAYLIGLVVWVSFQSGFVMRRLLITLALMACLSPSQLQSQEPQTKATGHYLFAWTGDAAHTGNDFLAVIDADPSSKSYGQLMTTLVTDQPSMRVHHTEYVMPASGMLFANDHDAGRTFIFDLRDPLHPKTVTSFTDMAGYMHPHSFLRLPNGHVLATFQHVHHGESEGQMGGSGGLVEIDDQGKLVRSASSQDPAFTGALLTPYSLAVLPELDRVISPNSDRKSVV